MTDSPRVIVVAVDAHGAHGAEVARLDLSHGADPEEALSAQGWQVTGLSHVVGREHPHEVELRYAVTSRVGRGPLTERPGAQDRSGPTADASSGVVSRAVPTDADLVRSPGERAHVFQRVAVYALLRSDRGLLLTQMSDRTNAAGRWGLVGGGLDPGETPEDALHREVWEESAQRVDRIEPWRVTTSHWVGRAPSGRLEDFHAVRVVYTAWCDTPTDPVVHDVGGTTEASAWFRPEALTGLPMVTSWSWLRPDLVAGLDVRRVGGDPTA